MLEEWLNNLMIQKIKEYARQGIYENVIDIGGKDGKYSRKVAKNLTVVDHNPQEISLDINYIKKDIWEFDTAEKFDLVVCSAFMEHFTKKEGILILKKINKFLSKKGLAYISCPNAWSLNRILGEFMGFGGALDLSEGDIKVGHKYLYNLSRLEDSAKKCLKFINSGSYFFKPLPSDDMNTLFDNKAFQQFALINSQNCPQLKHYLAEIYVIGEKKS